MTNYPIHPPGDAELRLQLRGLPKEREIERDLWASIQVDIQRSPKKKRPTWSSFAMAASLAFVAVLALPLLSPNRSIDANALNAQVVSSEVSAMDAEYQAALQEFSSIELAPEMQKQLQLIDDSANKLKQALNQSPHATYLIPMLRRTYLQRLQLTQRAITSNFT